MERNRVLWVVFSISLFLVVVLAAGLYFLRPEPAAGPLAAARGAPSPESFDVFEYVRGRSRLPLLEDRAGQPEDMIIIVGEPERPPAAEPRAPLSPDAVPPKAAVGGEEGDPGVRVARDIVSPRVSPALPAAPPPAPAPRVSGPAAPVERPSPRPAPPPAPRPTPRPAPKPAPQPVRVSEYWIQVGSFSSRGRADELSLGLSERGLAPKVTTRLVGGTTHYRVRLGPYPNRAEAGKFLEWVRALDGLGGSYISMVTVQRPQR